MGGRRQVFSKGHLTPRRRDAPSSSSATAEQLAAEVERSFVRGDESAIAVIRCRFEPRVRRLIRSRFPGRLNGADVDDILQEATWRAWAARDRFNEMNGGFFSWFVGIAVNAARERTRCRDLCQRCLGDADVEVPSRDAGRDSEASEGVDTEREHELDSVHCALQEALSGLSAPQQMVIKDGFGIDGPPACDQELSLDLGVACCTVRKLRSRALAALRSNANLAAIVAPVLRTSVTPSQRGGGRDAFFGGRCHSYVNIQVGDYPMTNFVQRLNGGAMLLSLCVFAAMTALATRGDAAHEERSTDSAPIEPALQKDATDALAAWTRALVTLNLEFETLDLPEDGEDRPAGAYVPTTRWIRTDSGQEYRLQKFGNGRRLVVCDGSRQYQAFYSLHPDDASFTKPDKMTISGPRGDQILIEPLYGLWFNRRNEWLGDLLQRDLAKYVAVEEVDGARCLRIEIEDMPGLFVTLWLDTEHGYLPRRAVTGPEGTGTFHNAITEFRELDVGIWFPWSGEFWYPVGGKKIRHRNQWRMRDVRVGEPIAASTFAAPPIPDGTHVVDETTLRSYVQGGVDGRVALETQIANEANQNLTRNATRPQTPRAADRLFWPIAIGIFSLAVLALLCRSSRVKRSPAARTE